MSRNVIRTCPFTFLVMISTAVLMLTFTGCTSKVARQKQLDEIVNNIFSIGKYAQDYRVRPDSLKGGNGSFERCQIPDTLLSTVNATFEIQIISRDTLVITGRSKLDNRNFVTVTRDSGGTMSRWTYGGVFQ
jgi:hypothetical protein